jgi:hypothetical protein
MNLNKLTEMDEKTLLSLGNSVSLELSERFKIFYKRQYVIVRNHTAKSYNNRTGTVEALGVNDTYVFMHSYPRDGLEKIWIPNKNIEPFQSIRLPKLFNLEREQLIALGKKIFNIHHQKWLERENKKL